MGEIVLKNITFDLTPEAINRAISEVRLFNGMLKMAMQRLIDYLGERGVEIARMELLWVGKPAYDTGALSESIKYEHTDDKVVISAGEGLTNAMGEPTNYALYIEFGNNTKYPNGYWYPAPYGWWTPKKGTHAGEKMAWTPGYGPRPFMQHTLYDLEDEAEMEGARVIAEYFGR